MEINDILREVLELRKAKFEEVGVAVVRQPCAEPVSIGHGEERLGQAIGQLIDNALQAMASQRERRLVVRARRANEGAVVEVECTARGGAVPSAGGTDVPSGETWFEEAVGQLRRCRESLLPCAGRVFVGAVAGGTAKFVIEVPAEPRTCHEAWVTDWTAVGAPSAPRAPSVPSATKSRESHPREEQPVRGGMDGHLFLG